MNGDIIVTNKQIHWQRTFEQKKVGRTEIDVKINLLHSVVRGEMSVEAYQGNKALMINLKRTQNFIGKPLSWFGGQGRRKNRRGGETQNKKPPKSVELKEINPKSLST